MYKKTFLLTKPAMTNLLVRNTRNLIDAIKAEGQSGKVVDIYIILHRYATDVIAEFTYGPTASTKSLVDTTYRHVAEQFALSDRRWYQLCQIHLPVLTSTWTKAMTVLRPEKQIGVFQYAWLAVQQAKSHKIFDRDESLVNLMMSNTNEMFSDAYIASELLDHLVRYQKTNLTSQIAGSDTTANTLTYLLHELSRPENHQIQSHLHKELVTFTPESPSLSEIDKLPFLDAVLREGLRVFSAIPFLEPREVPSGGRVLNSYFLPEQVTP